jgi:hypothetical protein
MKKILMFDSTHAYLTFVKRKFKNEYEISSYEKINKSELNIASYDSIIFIISNETELVDLMYIYAKADSLLIWSSFKKINEQLSKLDNIFVLNFNQSKNGIAEQLRFWIDLPKPFQQDKTDTINRVYR